VDRYRNVQIQYRGTPIYVSSVDASILRRYAKFGWMNGGDENWEPVQKGAVIVSESFYRRFGLGAGDSVTLDGFQGAVHLKIAAVFYDYTTEHGLIMMDRSTYFKVFHDPTINNIAIFMDPGNPQKKEILKDIARRAKARGLPVASREKLHGSILEVFDATFSVTRSMRVLAILVAFFGIAGALLTLFMERQKEFGIYRALGFSTGQVAAMTLLEGMGMGLIAYILSLGVGTALAWVLIRVINLQSFHWTIFFHFSWDPYWLALATAVLASLGAALYPIGKVYQTYPQMQIREE
jgi:putative ABC transport system permease protein